MIPLIFWGRRGGESEAVKAARLAHEQREYETLMRSTRATVAWQLAAAKAQSDWKKYADGLTTTGPLAGQPVSHDSAWSDYLARMGVVPQPQPSLADRLRSGHLVSLTPHSMIHPYRITREFNNLTDLEIFKSIVFSTPGLDYRITGATITFSGSAEQLLKVDARYKEILRANELSERVRNTPPETRATTALDARALNAAEADPRTMGDLGAGERKKNRCFESITQVTVKGPNSGEPYTVRVWRSLVALELNEDVAINAWASHLNDKIDAMSAGGRKAIVNEAWIIHQLESFMRAQECTPRIVAVEVKDSNGAGKLLYPDWS